MRWSSTRSVTDGRTQSVQCVTKLSCVNGAVAGTTARIKLSVPKGATKVQLTTCFQALGSGGAKDIEFLVTGRKWQQVTTGGSVAASAKENTTGSNRWSDIADDNSGTTFKSGAGGRWRGYTNATKTSNKITVTEGDNLYIVPSREFPLVELKNSGSSAVAAGDILDIAIGRNRADAQNVVGTSVDNGSADQHVVIYWVKIDFLE